MPPGIDFWSGRSTPSFYQGWLLGRRRPRRQSIRHGSHARLFGAPPRRNRIGSLSGRNPGTGGGIVAFRRIGAGEQGVGRVSDKELPRFGAQGGRTLSAGADTKLRTPRSDAKVSPWKAAGAAAPGRGDWVRIGPRVVRRPCNHWELAGSQRQRRFGGRSARQFA